MISSTLVNWSRAFSISGISDCDKVGPDLDVEHSGPRGLGLASGGLCKMRLPILRSHTIHLQNSRGPGWIPGAAQDPVHHAAIMSVANLRRTLVSKDRMLVHPRYDVGDNMQAMPSKNVCLMLSNDTSYFAMSRLKGYIIPEWSNECIGQGLLDAGMTHWRNIIQVYRVRWCYGLLL